MLRKRFEEQNKGGQRKDRSGKDFDTCKIDPRVRTEVTLIQLETYRIDLFFLLCAFQKPIIQPNPFNCSLFLWQRGSRTAVISWLHQNCFKSPHSVERKDYRDIVCDPLIQRLLDAWNYHTRM